MKLVGDGFLARFGGRIVNTHPALSPSFPGMHGPADALAYGVKVTGGTLFVVDERRRHRPDRRADRGAVERRRHRRRSLHERIKVAERAMLVDTSAGWRARASPITDRKVRFGHD